MSSNEQQTAGGSATRSGGMNLARPFKAGIARGVLYFVAAATIESSPQISFVVLNTILA